MALLTDQDVATRSVRSLGAQFIAWMNTGEQERVRSADDLLKHPQGTKYRLLYYGHEPALEQFTLFSPTPSRTILPRASRLKTAPIVSTLPLMPVPKWVGGYDGANVDPDTLFYIVTGKIHFLKVRQSRPLPRSIHLSSAKGSNHLP